MCGRYAAILPPEAMVELFQTLNTIDFPPRYNIAPTQPIVAIWQDEAGRRAHLVRWGLVPGWVKDPREFPLLVNARSESMAEKPAFRTALRHHRCIVPATGYYEWHTGPDKKKTPYFITLANGEPMALAGLYSTWMGPDGEEVDTAALITVPAGPDLAHIHDRMPAIVEKPQWEQWLDVRNVGAAQALQLALPLGDGKVKAHPVSTRVNTAKFDDLDLIRPVTPETPAQPETKKASGDKQLSLF